MKKTLFFLALALSMTKADAQSLRSFKLENGLTVILDSNPNDTHVSGKIVVNVGSADEKDNATGVAHYLEHMLFKGTDELGTIDWEKEKIHYNTIIKLYDELQTATTQVEIDDINKRINEESQKEAKYIVTNELSAAIQEMGGVGLNAYTNIDRTVYYNTFPSNQLQKWLELYSHRFINPIFRLFQTELETVYEEKNRSADNMFLPFINKVSEVVYGENDPYARPIIGKTEHLKKPWMSGMIDFYNTWYVPNNMALILSGNINPNQAKAMIQHYFSRLEYKELPVRDNSFDLPQKNIKKKVKLTPYLVASKNYLISNNISDKDRIALDMISSLLNNNSQTGLYNNLMNNGDIMSASAAFTESKRVNRFSISYSPNFDINQRRQESFSHVEDLIDESLSTIENGTYDDWLLDNVKVGMLQNWEIAMSSQSSRSTIYTTLFNLGKGLSVIGQYSSLVTSIDKQYIKEVYMKYLSDEYILVESGKGSAKKPKKIKKPIIEPIVSLSNVNSDYYNNFIKMKVRKSSFKPFDINEVKVTDFGDKIKLHYLKNDKNNIFKLVVKFHAGEVKFPELEYSTTLLNNAGVLGQYSSTELRKEFGKLNVNYSFSSDKYATYVVLSGYDDNLGAACQLISRLVLMPSIKDESLNGIIGRIINQRNIETKSIAIEKDALKKYLIQGDESSYIKRKTADEIISLTPTKLASDFHAVSEYQADIHYYGKIPHDKLESVLKNNLAFSSRRKEGIKQEQDKTIDYNKNTILLVNNSKATQSHIFLYLKLDTIALEDIPKVKAFNEYFSGGFNGLVTKEIRVNRALAYTSNATINVPTLRNWNALMIGYVGTQADKTADAVSVMINLLNDLPKYQDRMSGIKNYMINSSQIESEDLSVNSLKIDRWKKMGYNNNPAIQELPLVKELTFEDIEDVFNRLVKDNNIGIGIIGRVKDMDVKGLKQFGEIKKVNVKKLFSNK